MKKLVYLFGLSLLLVPSVFWYCNDNSYYTQSQIDSKKIQLQNLSYSRQGITGINSGNASQLQSEINQLEIQLQKDNNTYQMCLVFNKWYDASNRWEHETAVDYYKQYLWMSWDTEKNRSIARENLILELTKLAIVRFNKKDYDKLISYCREIISYDTENVWALQNIWLVYWFKNDIKNAIAYYETAYRYSTDTEEIKSIQWAFFISFLNQ